MILAMLMACGGHWAVLQTVAWTKMIADFSQKEGLQSAITKTFDGCHACKLCNCIKAGKASEKKQEPQAQSEKLTFILQPFKITYLRPGNFQVFSERYVEVMKRANEPPTPPPRGELV